MEWEFSRHNERHGVWSIDYPSAWTVTLPNRAESHSAYFANYDINDPPSNQFGPGDVSIDITLTSARQLDRPEAQAIMVDERSSTYAVVTPDQDPDLAVGGAELWAWAVVPLDKPVPYGSRDLVAINVAMISGSDAPRYRELFFAMLDSLEIHR